MRLTRLPKVPETEGYEWASLRWLRRQVYENRIPSYKMEGLVLVDLDDLDDRVAAGRREAS